MLYSVHNLVNIPQPPRFRPCTPTGALFLDHTRNPDGLWTPTSTGEGFVPPKYVQRPSVIDAGVPLRRNAMYPFTFSPDQLRKVWEGHCMQVVTIILNLLTTISYRKKEVFANSS